MLEGAKRSGLLVHDGTTLRFLPAGVTVRVAPLPNVARVPGAPAELLGIALLDGAILPLVTLQACEVDARSVIVCTHLGEEIGLVGLEVIKTGYFEAHEDGVSVRHEGQSARPVDLATIYARLQSGPWAGRFRG